MRNFFKIGKALSALTVLGVMSAPSTKADLLSPSGLLIDNVTHAANGDFSGFPDFTSWSTNGNTAVVGTDYKNTIAPNNAQFAAISSNTAHGVGGSSGLASTNLSAGDTFFGLAGGTLASKSAADYSGILQGSITVTAGQSISFNFDFATNELNPAFLNRDFAFYTLQASGDLNATFHELASADPSTSPRSNTSNLDGINADFSQETGFQSFTTGPLAAGTYTIGFGVSDANATPLPSAAWGGLALFGGMALVQIARRRKAVIA